MADAKQGRFKVLRGSLLLKIFLLIAFLMIVSMFIFGMPQTLTEWVWEIAKMALGAIIIVFILKGISSLRQGQMYPSPTENFKEKITKIAIDNKPFNVKTLSIRGEDMRVYSRWGKIKGLGFIPYFSAPRKRDKKGNILYKEKKDRSGVIERNKRTGAPKQVPLTEPMTEKDGDWFFVVKTGWQPWKKPDLVRAHPSFCSDIGEEIWIKTVNLFPVGDYFYPCEQAQSDITRIQTQHQAEALIETHQEFLDLLSNVTQMSLGADPILQRIRLEQTEEIASQQQGALIGRER